MSKPHADLTVRRLASLSALSAAGIAAVGGLEAEAGIIVTSLNTDIGFAAGNSTGALASLAGGHSFGIATTTFFGFSRSLIIAGTANANFRVKTQQFSAYPFARPLNAGVKFGTAPVGAASGAYIQYVSTGGVKVGPALFSDKYYAFSFVNGGTTLYGWVEGSLTNTSYQGLSYHFTRYAYEDTGVMIATGQTSLAVPEPASATMALLGGALVAGAAGVRRWKKAKAAAAIAAE